MKELQYIISKIMGYEQWQNNVGSGGVVISVLAIASEGGGFDPGESGGRFL